MRELTTKQLKHKFTDGTEEIVDIGVDAENVDEINFEQAEERENIKTRDGLLVIFGKIAKWYADLKNVAWSGSYRDLADKPFLDDIEGTLSIEKGGTGAENAKTARDNLGLGTAAIYGVATNDNVNDSKSVASSIITYEHGIEIDTLKRAFQDGVNKIYNKLAGLGFTPSANSPDAICIAIQDLYDSGSAILDNLKTQSWRTDFGGTTCSYVASKSGLVNIWFSVAFVYDNAHNANGGDVYIRRNGTAIHKFSASDLGYNVSAGGNADYKSTDFDRLDKNPGSYYFDAGDTISIEADGNNSSGMIVVAIW